MILDFILALVAGSILSLGGYLLIVGAENRKKYRWLQENAPGLKVLESPSLFGGHTNKLVNSRHNLFIIDELIKKHGPTVGFYFDTRPAVMTTDLELIKTFTVYEQIHINRAKINLPTRELVQDSLMCAEGDQWARMRKAVAPAFAAHKIKSASVHSDIETIIGKFVAAIEKRLDDELAQTGNNFFEADAEDICHRYALSLVFTNFYKQPDTIDFELSRPDRYVHMIDSASHRMVGSIFIKAVGAFPVIIPFMEWLLFQFHEQGVLRRTIMGYIQQQTKLNFEAFREMQHTKEEPTAGDQQSYTLRDGSKFRRNMIDYITDQYREGRLTRREYFHSTFFLFMAADKTTTDALARTLYELARNPGIQHKLRESVAESGADSEYLSWVIHEVLRLYPPAATGCSRTVARDIQTKHGLVPKGTFVLTATYTIHRLKEYWGEDADDFRPERWANAKDFHPCQFLAFGGGRRACPGRELALKEMKMLLSVLIRRYKFDESHLHTVDNSRLMNAPMFFTLVFDTPTFVRISRLDEREVAT